MNIGCSALSPAPTLSMYGERERDLLAWCLTNFYVERSARSNQRSCQNSSFKKK